MYILDLSKPQNIQEFTEKLIKNKIKIDVLVNNAGINLSSAGESGGRVLSTDILRKTLEVNLIGLADLTENLLTCINDGGHIVNISSGSGSITEFSGTNIPSYAISKTAVNMYTRTLANRLNGRHITVSSFDPGWVKTDMGGSYAPRSPEQPAEELYELATSKVESGYFWHRGKKRAW